MTETFVAIKEVGLNNHCPICYNQEGLRLTFKQKTVENRFYKAVTSKIEHEMVCKNCNNVIYPVNWTDDMERVFDYHKKSGYPAKSFNTLKKSFLDSDSFSGFNGYWYRGHFYLYEIITVP